MFSKGSQQDLSLNALKEAFPLTGTEGRSLHGEQLVGRQ